jgi:hypothetical protein
VAAIERLKRLFRSLRERNSSGFPDGLGLTALLCERYSHNLDKWRPVPLGYTRHTIISKKLAKVGSLDVRLSAEDLAEIDDANIRIHGARYPEEHMKRVGL